MLLELCHTGYVRSHFLIDVLDSAVNTHELFADIIKIFYAPNRSYRPSRTTRTEHSPFALWSCWPWGTCNAPFTFNHCFQLNSPYAI